MEEATIGTITIKEVEGYVVLSSPIDHLTITEEEFWGIVAHYAYLIFQSDTDDRER